MMDVGGGSTFRLSVKVTGWGWGCGWVCAREIGLERAVAHFRKDKNLYEHRYMTAHE